MDFRRIASLRTPGAFRGYLADCGADLPFDDEVASGADAPLAQPYRLRDGTTIGNRFCVLPMEGWDGTADGRPSELTLRRWRRFGQSGAKLIWGGEATAVRSDGRANPHQLVISSGALGGLAALREALVREHVARFGSDAGLLVGLQLTHSGRFSRPHSGPEPKILYHHPLLDARSGVDSETAVLTDTEIEDLVEDFVRGAAQARSAGFDFVDVKHCHGYLGHEFLSAVDRPGRYGGSFENRTRFLREVTSGIQASAPGLRIGVRLSAFDFAPFQAGPQGQGEMVAVGAAGYRYAFGGDGTGAGIDLTEPRAFLDLCAELGIELVCITGGSPYYTPHIQRPAMFPPSDAYGPPEDPLLGVARQVGVAASLKRHRPELAIVGSAFSYLQEWLPNVAQAVIRQGLVDFIGLGRSVLPYPDLAADVLEGQPLDRRRICRTFSDCTTAPRLGLVSGCYPLDDFYRDRSEAEVLARAKRRR